MTGRGHHHQFLDATEPLSVPSLGVLRGLCGDTTGPIDWLPQLDSLPQPGLFIETSLFQTSEVTARDHADDFALVDDR